MISTIEIVIPSFIQLSKTNFWSTYSLSGEFFEQFEIGLFHIEGGWIEEEILVRWFNKSGIKTMEIGELRDVKKQKKHHSVIFDLLEDNTTSPEVLHKRLIELNYRDITNLY